METLFPRCSAVPRPPQQANPLTHKSGAPAEQLGRRFRKLNALTRKPLIEMQAFS